MKLQDRHKIFNISMSGLVVSPKREDRRTICGTSCLSCDRVLLLNFSKIKCPGTIGHQS
uniref:Uncharacterized protein n=1 Tax=Setaria italica TaxID=4555 RepID=K4A472_SETIT